jgi:NAD(P)-dependent dehydrogenase (short-subunit alcohol dehydrogenase family)
VSERRLLVLGGTSGIGKAVADMAEEREFRQFKEQNINAVGREDFDIRDEPQLAQYIRVLQPTDVVYSVGVNELDWSRELHLQTFRQLMEVNVWGFLSVIQLLQTVPIRPVNVVAVTSDAAWRPMRTSSIYCASKAALEMAVRVASREMAPLGWRVNAVAPGKVADTPMTKYVDARVMEIRGWTEEQASEYERQSSPIGRMVTTEEVAEVILNVLNGPKAQTGEIVAVNGGR